MLTASYGENMLKYTFKYRVVLEGTSRKQNNPMALPLSLSKCYKINESNVKEFGDFKC